MLLTASSSKGNLLQTLPMANPMLWNEHCRLQNKNILYKKKTFWYVFLLMFTAINFNLYNVQLLIPCIPFPVILLLYYTSWLYNFSKANKGLCKRNWGMFIKHR